MAKDQNEAAEKLRQQLDVLAEFGLQAFRADNLEELLTRATELVAEGCHVQRAKILELLPEDDEFLVRAGVNWNPGVVGQVRFGTGNDSPAGYALHHDEAVVSPDLDAERRFKIPQVLIDHGIKSMVNVTIAGKDGPFGVLEVDATRKIEFDEHDISFLRNYANVLAAAIERHRSHAALQETWREQSILVQELEHRVKNMLGLVQALANQTSAGENSDETYRKAFLGRLQALAQAESLVFEDHAQSVYLEQLVERAIEPFKNMVGEAITVDGPSLLLPARIGRMLALALHELGTNAIKHGGLSVENGRVRLSWRVDDGNTGRQVCLRWREEGGPPVTPPSRRGFGSKLLTRLAGAELDGKVELKYASGGLDYQVTFPVGDR